MKINTLFVAVVYMPPAGSTHYTSGQDIAAHYEMLTADVAMFSGQGHTLLLGDFNARTGMQPEHASSAHDTAWDVLRQVNGAVPPPHHPLQASVPQRVSVDNMVNNMGKHLLRMCDTCGLVIMNGRTAGDQPGQATFDKLGYSEANARRSVIDYAIASLGLVAQEDGMRVGVSMSVLDFRACPTRRCGGRFDHRPVTLSLPIACITQLFEHAYSGHDGDTRGLSATEMGRHTPQQLRWDAARQAEYVDILMTDGGVLGLLHSMRSDAPGRDAEGRCTCKPYPGYMAGGIYHARERWWSYQIWVWVWT